MKRRVMFVAVFLTAVVVVAACGGTAPTPTPTPQPTLVPPPTATPQPTAPPAPPQSAAGESVFSDKCSGCHSTPPGATVLSNYSTAQSLFEGIRRSMPKNAPGSLSDEQYYDVLSFLLVKAGLIQADQAVNAGTVVNIKLRK